MHLSHTAPGSVVAINRQAKFNYQIEEEFEAGIVLQGSEVKSLRQGRANIGDGFVIARQGALWLRNCYIGEFTEANRMNHNPLRERKLLLKKREIKKLQGKISEKGYSVVPMKLFFNQRNLAKLIIGLGKGKKQYDKRETEKQRDWQRQKAREFRAGNE